MRIALPMVLALCATTAQAQSTIFGLDVRQGMFFTTDTATFVASKVDIGINTDPVFALDFDSTATTLWGINNTTLEYGTFDLVAGSFNPAGTVVGPAGATGLTAAADGSTWYLMEYDGTLGQSFLWRGDVTTGTFVVVGMSSAGIMIDISISSTGSLYGHNISDDSLYSINTATGAGTLIGPTGLAANFAQGMDFDWTNDNLYAAIYTGGGTGMFSNMDLTTGAATMTQDTVSTNGEFEIAIQEAASGSSPFTATCFGDGSGASCGCGNEVAGTTGGCRNSLNVTGVLTASGGADTTNDSVTLNCSGVRTQPGLFFQGNNTIGGGTGITFGDGIRCCGQNVLRVLITVPPGPEPATATMPAGAVSSTFPGTINPGDKKCYQYWYRDPGGSPCGANFNLSNAISVIWS